jgi:serine/threonine-protein kinase
MLVGTKVGAYEVIAKLGEGGMGQVFRARDTKLHRDVALKILPDSFAGDADRRQRFEREARTLAALNHPGIAQIYGTVETAGHEALVMELVPGHTLDEVIRDGAARSGAGLPIPDAVRIAAQMAEALEVAHEAGIVHRDLKPANIKIREDGTVKVLDFGLARASDPAADNPAVSPSMATMLSPAVTQAGVILGTAGYMSPEQAKGRPADKRSDIWAFGAVVWEMLTGRRLFAGATVNEVIASVIKDAPDLDALPANTPPGLRRLLERCLERDPRLRLRDIGEARIALARADEPRQAMPPPRARSAARMLPLALGALGIAAAAGVAGWIMKPGATAAPVRRFDLPKAIAESSLLAFAPDGQRIAYVKDGRLYVHALASGVAADLGAVSLSGRTLFWSPDSQTIGFAAESAIRTIPAAGGTPFAVGRIPGPGQMLTGLWLPDDTIVFSVWRDSIYRVRAAGGTPELHVALDPAKEVDAHFLTMAPGNRLVLGVHVLGEDDAQRLDIVENGRRTSLSSDTDMWFQRFVPPNHLLFIRRLTNPGVWTAPFENGALDLTRAAMFLPGAIDFDTARDGTLLAKFPARDRHSLVWLTRSGHTTPLPGPALEITNNSSFELAPDDGRVLISTVGPDFRADVVVRDLATGTDTLVPPPRQAGAMTFGASVSWAPWGRLFFGVGGVGTSEIYDWPADGSTGGRRLMAGMNARMTADGKEIYFTRDEKGARLRRATLGPNGTAEESEAVFPANAEPTVRWFDVSPDGHLLAFTDRRLTDGPDIFVATLPDLRERRQVTSNGGSLPKFSRDGKSLWYFSGAPTAGATRRQLHVVPVTMNPLTIGAPSVVLVEDPSNGISFTSFDVAKDGRLLMTRRADPQPGDEARVVLMQNWLAARPPTSINRQ